MVSACSCVAPTVLGLVSPLPTLRLRVRSPSVWPPPQHAKTARAGDPGANLWSRLRRLVPQWFSTVSIPRACLGENRNVFKKNSLLRHGTGTICRGSFTPTPMRENRAHWGPRLALTRSSLGLGQDDRVLVACLKLALRKGSSPCGETRCAAPTALEVIFPLTHTCGFACARLQCGLTCGRASGALCFGDSDNCVIAIISKRQRSKRVVAPQFQTIFVPCSFISRASAIIFVN